MNKIDELIEKLCPNGVEYKNLGEFCEIKTGTGITKKDTIENGKYKIISGGVEPLGLCEITNRKANTVTIARAGSAGFVNFIDKDFYLNDKCFSIIPTNNCNTRYLYYALSNIQENIYALKSSGTVPTVNTEKVSKIRIPVPPLEVQCEIVHILDDFTLLSAELSAGLSAELKARQKQYEYYKEVLLENNEAKKIKLNSCLLNVENIKWKQTNENYVYIDLSSVDRERHRIINTNEINKTNAPSRAQQIVKTDDILFGGTRPMLKRSCIVENKFNNGICSTGFCVLRANRKIVNPKWIYFMISTNNFYNYVEQNQKGASYPAISDCIVKEYMITLPSLEEQGKIINLLDKFETYINDISEGLPAEIEARKKQYEYYRDKLLAFEEEKNNG